MEGFSRFKGVVWTEFLLIDIVRASVLSPLSFGTKSTMDPNITYALGAGFEIDIWQKVQSVGIVSESLNMRTRRYSEVPATRGTLPGDEYTKADTQRILATCVMF